MASRSAPRRLSPRSRFWSPEGPYAAIRVCITLFAAQLILLPAMIFLAAAVGLAGDIGILMAEAMALLWLAIPLGAVYGIYLGAASGLSEDPWAARGLGILVNAIYLAGGLLFAAVMIGASGQ